MRAVAVLAVVLFHVDANWLPGSYIGVDIFFVISGYLITGILLREIGTGRFSFTGFFSRRVRRILPAMLAVVATTLVAGQFVLLPGDLVKLAESALATVFSVANIYFTYFLDTSYFAPDASHQPLLHMWSLGVEEQFYLFWPALLLVAMRTLQRVWVVLLTTGLIFGSFLIGELILQSQPMFAYYMLPARAGQLLLGALCAFAASADKSWRWMETADNIVAARTLLVAMQLGGAALIALSLMYLDHESAFPGLNAIPVTVGAALLILAGGKVNSPVTAVLSWSPMRAIGLISYSMYLWHWPVLAFAKYLYGTISLGQQLGALGVILALSYLSYRWVEVPFRRSREGFSRLLLKQFLLPASVVSAACFALFLTDGYGLHRYSTHYESALTDQPVRAGNKEFVCQRTRVTAGYMRQPECVIGATFAEVSDLPFSRRDPNILLWGDSNAAHYVGMVGELAEEFGFAFRNVAHGLCLPLLHAPARFSPADRANDCRKSASVVQSRLNLYNTIIISGAWKRPIEKFPDFLTELGNTIRELKRQGKDVIVLGRVPYFPAFDAECAAKALKVVALNCESRASVNIAEVEKYNGKLRQAAVSAGARYYDVSHHLCSGDVCSPYLQGKPLYRDPGHIGFEASVMLGKIARRDPMAREVFGPLEGSMGGGTPRGLPWRDAPQD